MSDIFHKERPNHELYGYGALQVGEICEVELIKHGKTPSEIQNFVHSYGQRTKKKFRTKTKDSILYIKRIK